MTSPTPIPPALSPDSWKAFADGYGIPDGFDFNAAHTEDGMMLSLVVEEPAYLCGQERHALAALCLVGQPFGFTQEDVNALRHYAAWEKTAANWCPEGYVFGTMDEINRLDRLAKADELLSLAARIASLLPPPETP